MPHAFSTSCLVPLSPTRTVPLSPTRTVPLSPTHAHAYASSLSVGAADIKKEHQKINQEIASDEKNAKDKSVELKIGHADKEKKYEDLYRPPLDRCVDACQSVKGTPAAYKIFVTECVLRPTPPLAPPPLLTSPSLSSPHYLSRSWPSSRLAHPRSQYR